ncbi:hypothetical protein Bbelb_189820 [Branchiostoma belcheri]|nr:hypothetical protein Bbelb_189820 [Branchiostoma belcheri]
MSRREPRPSRRCTERQVAGSARRQMPPAHLNGTVQKVSFRPPLSAQAARVVKLEASHDFRAEFFTSKEETEPAGGKDVHADRGMVRLTVLVIAATWTSRLSTSLGRDDEEEQMSTKAGNHGTSGVINYETPEALMLSRYRCCMDKPTAVLFANQAEKCRYDDGSIWVYDVCKFEGDSGRPSDLVGARKAWLTLSQTAHGVASDP